MSVFHGAAAVSGGLYNESNTLAGTGLEHWQEPAQQHAETWDAMETYFECITTCSLEDGECVTRCVEQLRETA
ncbi:MAG: hypothetical protein ACKOXO_05455 [Cyanobium sp.]